eukprot:2917187-Alexandrium_andersonii.AAC.1
MQRIARGRRPAASRTPHADWGGPRAAGREQPAKGRPARTCARGRQATSSGAERGMQRAARRTHSSASKSCLLYTSPSPRD